MCPARVSGYSHARARRRHAYGRACVRPCGHVCAFCSWYAVLSTDGMPLGATLRARSSRADAAAVVAQADQALAGEDDRLRRLPRRRRASRHQ
eukprot:933968-Pleurochrysis_carterae.AAC.1